MHDYKYKMKSSNHEQEKLYRKNNEKNSVQLNSNSDDLELLKSETDIEQRTLGRTRIDEGSYENRLIDSDFAQEKKKYSVKVSLPSDESFYLGYQKKEKKLELSTSPKEKIKFNSKETTIVKGQYNNVTAELGFTPERAAANISTEEIDDSHAAVFVKHTIDDIKLSKTEAFHRTKDILKVLDEKETKEKNEEINIKINELNEKKNSGGEKSNKDQISREITNLQKISDITESVLSKKEQLNKKLAQNTIKIINCIENDTVKSEEGDWLELLIKKRRDEGEGDETEDTSIMDETDNEVKERQSDEEVKTNDVFNTFGF